MRILAAIDTLIFLLLVAAAALFRLLTKAASSKPPPTEDQVPQPPDIREQAPATSEQSNEEQIRKFLEALGQPRTAPVPKPAPPRTDVPPRPVAPVQPPRSSIPIPKLSRRRRETEPATPPQKLRREVIFPSTDATPDQPTTPGRRSEAPIFEVQETGTVSPIPTATARMSFEAVEPSKPSGQTNELVALLRTPGGLRQAIVLREIFGAPRSLRPLEDLPGTA